MSESLSHRDDEPSVMGAGSELSPRPRVIVPDLCKHHQYDFVSNRLQMGSIPDEQWKPLVITTTLLLFALAIKSEKVQKPVREGQDLQTVLNRHGCLACSHYRAYTFVAKFIRSKGLWHAQQVAEGRVEDISFREWT